MTREEAKEVLLLHRPGRRAENDPKVAEALQLAAKDPELAKWLQQQHDFHAAIVKEFGDIEPSANLKTRIIADAKILPVNRSAFQRGGIWALAAAIVIVVGIVTLWTPRRNEDAPTFANFRSRMTSFALRTYQMDIVTNNAAAVREHLAQNGAPFDFPLTPDLEKLPVKGGGRISWQNQPVAMMCFALTNKETAFMFVVDEKAIDGPVTRREVISNKALSSVTWTREGKVYLLAAAGKPEVLAALAPP